MAKLSLNVLMISTIFYPKVNGTVIAVTNLMKSLQEDGCIVHLLTRKIPGIIHDKEVRNFPVIRVGPTFKSPISRIALSLNQVRVGIRIMKKERIDVIHAHGTHSLITGFVLSKIFHRPLVATYHGFQRLWFKKVRWKPDLNLALTYPISKFLIHNTNAIIAQSQTLKNVIAKLYRINRGKIHVVSHSIEEDCFKFAPSSSRTKPIILFVGSYIRVHGVDLLVKAAPTVLKVFPQAKFILIGSGPQREPLQRLIKSLKLEKSVFLKGPVYNRSELVKYYSSAKIVVIPLKYQGYILSLVALEAMATGKPVVTTMTLDPQLDKYGIYKAKNKPDELAKPINKILSLNEEDYLKVAASARKYVEEHSSKRIVASKIKNLYRKLIDAY